MGIATMIRIRNWKKFDKYAHIARTTKSKRIREKAYKMLNDMIEVII